MKATPLYRTTPTAGGGTARYGYILVGKEKISHGQVVQFYPNGARKSESNFRYGVLYGRCRSWFPTGRLGGIGNYLRGKKDGAWRSWYLNGTRREYLNYRSGKLHGKCTYWWAPGMKADIRLYRSGVEITGGITRKLQYESSRFPNGRLELQEEYYWHLGKKILHGTVFKGNKNGVYVELPYRDGVQFGRGAEFNATKGRPTSEFYIDGGKRKELDYSKIEF
jgi:hypothetical protein